MRYMKYWVVVKMLWNILLVGLALITAILGLTRWELKDVFYILAIEFFIWFMLNEILELFKPIPVMMIPHKPKEKDNDHTNN